MWELVPALVAGNTVVMKPASASVLTGLLLADQARRAGMPPGVFNAVALPGSATDVLLDHPDVAKVLFTGSVEVGRHVARRCAERLAPAAARARRQGRRGGGRRRTPRADRRPVWCGPPS